MSSTSFGSPSAMHHHGVRPNVASPPTPAPHVAGTGGSPNHTVLTRNDAGGGGGGGSSHASPSPTFQRHQNFVHDASEPQRALPHHHHHYNHHNHNNNHHNHNHQREIIELTDSDTDSASRKKSDPPRPGHLQPPFDPISRVAAPNGNSGKSGHRASASPSIASLINVDTHPLPKKSKSTNPSPTSVSFVETSNQANKRSKKSDVEHHSPKSKAPTTNSPAPSPKPIRLVAPPSGSGGGLLSNVLTGIGGGGGSGSGGGGGGGGEDESKLPNINIHVPLNGEHNKYINFAKLAEERYGWAALNPRLAKARAVIDSGDEMMLDGSESESNVEMGSTNEGPGAAKRKYQDVYDKDDPFIDDSEMLWEEQAAASKDGFFVYSGPLIPEGDRPQIERADGTIKRGRGRGQGSRGGATSTRGTGTTARKPRITKKEKEKLEKEKEERERFVLAAAQAKALQPH